MQGTDSGVPLLSVLNSIRKYTFYGCLVGELFIWLSIVVEIVAIGLREISVPIMLYGATRAIIMMVFLFLGPATLVLFSFPFYYFNLRYRRKVSIVYEVLTIISLGPTVLIWLGIQNL